MTGLPLPQLDALGAPVTDPVTGEERRFQGNQAFGCGVAFNHDLDGGRWSYGFDHGCNVDKGAAYRVREIRYARAEPHVSAYGQWKPRRDLRWEQAEVEGV